MAWHVYIIKTGIGTFYTGISTDPERRLQEHLAGKAKGAKYLKGKGPLHIVWTQMAENRSVATKLEIHIKRLSASKKQAIIDGRYSFEWDESKGFIVRY